MDLGFKMGAGLLNPWECGYREEEEPEMEDGEVTGEDNSQEDDSDGGSDRERETGIWGSRWGPGC